MWRVFIGMTVLATGLLLILMLTACSSHRRPPPVREEKLVVHIHTDGTKLFAYAVASAGGPGGASGRGPAGHGAGGGGRPPAGSGQSPGGGMSAGQGPRGGGPRGVEGGNLTEGLEHKLSTTGYCRDGYVEMERYEYQNARWIRGECQEAANEQDWVRFGSRVSLY